MKQGRKQVVYSIIWNRRDLENNIYIMHCYNHIVEFVKHDHVTSYKQDSEA